jgi:hypothetical protein
MSHQFKANSSHMIRIRQVLARERKNRFQQKRVVLASFTKKSSLNKQKNYTAICCVNALPVSTKETQVKILKIFFGFNQFYFIQFI